MEAYILRRNNWGNPSCNYIADNFPGLVIVNKDKENIPEAKWCIRWATNSEVPGKPKIINKVSAMKETSDKGTFRKKLSDVGLAPKTYNHIGHIEELNFPVVVRPTHHYEGKNFHFCKNIGEMAIACATYSSYYISEYIQKEAEYRVFVVSGRVIAILRKHPKDINSPVWGSNETDYKWEYIAWDNWSDTVCHVAFQSFANTELDFGALDIIVKDGQAWCLEINTGPRLTPYYGKKFAQAFRWIIEHDDRKHIPPSDEKGYHAFIHPALLEE